VARLRAGCGADSRYPPRTHAGRRRGFDTPDRIALC